MTGVRVASVLGCLLAGCSCALDPSGFVARDGGDARDGGMDAAARDAGAGFDGGPDFDAGPRPDAGRRDAGGGTDAGGVDAALPTRHAQLRYEQMYGPDGSAQYRRLTGYFSDGAYDDGCATVATAGACRVLDCRGASGSLDAGTISVTGLGTSLVTGTARAGGYDTVATGVPEGVSLTQPVRFEVMGLDAPGFTSGELLLGAAMRPDFAATHARSAPFVHTWNPATIGDETRLEIHAGTDRVDCAVPTSSGEITVAPELLAGLSARFVAVYLFGARIYEETHGDYTVVFRVATAWQYEVELE